MSSENTGIAEGRVNFVLRHKLPGATSWVFTKGNGVDLGTIKDESTRAQMHVQRVDMQSYSVDKRTNSKHWEDEVH